MAESDVSPITELLRLFKSGDSEAEQRLFKTLFVELRRMASSKMRSERGDHTLQPTALVNEAYMRMAANRDKTYHDRAHFLAAAAQVMHCVLIDYARSRKARKRLGEVRRVELSEAIPAVGNGWSEQMISFDSALKRLAEFDPNGAKVVELRVFAGMTVEELAKVMGKSPRMIKRYHSAATAWLLKDLADRGGKAEAGAEGADEPSGPPDAKSRAARRGKM
jgi:RNA polymerase sigma factor (TIGR02999 family)